MVFRMIIMALIPLLAFYLYERFCHLRLRQYASFPQLKPSLLWGHLKGLHEFIVRGKTNRHIDIVFLEVKRQLGNAPLFILDLRPVQYVLCVVGSHEVAEQVSKSTKSFPYSMNKSPTMRLYERLLGPRSILTAEAEEWKGLRKRFNPGFAPKHLVTLLPVIMDKAGQFLRNLDRHAASGEAFRLDELCSSLTFDIIGAVTMGIEFGAQLDKERQSEFVQLYRELTTSYQSGSSSNRSVQWTWLLSPRAAQHRRRLDRRIDLLLKEHIQRVFAERQHSEITGSRKDHSVLSLSLQDADNLDLNILDQTCDQLKSFLFAGHDTTSIVLQWTFYELSRTPHVLKAIRDELDEIFGVDCGIDQMRDKLCSSQGEELTSRMYYVSAVIKEILRLYPPSGSARYMSPGSGFTVQLPDDGGTLCLDGMVVYNCNTLVHRDEAVYGDTKDDFIPERWLDSNPHRTPPSAWRPFERGPRNCIGQELAMLEARVIVACTVRLYDFAKVGLGAVVLDSQGNLKLNDKGQYGVESPLYNVGYLRIVSSLDWIADYVSLHLEQTMQVTAKPVDGTRMRVSTVGHVGVVIL